MTMSEKKEFYYKRLKDQFTQLEVEERNIVHCNTMISMSDEQIELMRNIMCGQVVGIQEYFDAKAFLDSAQKQKIQFKENLLKRTQVVRNLRAAIKDTQDQIHMCEIEESKMGVVYEFKKRG